MGINWRDDERMAIRKNNNYAVHHVTVDENENGEIEGCQRVDKKFSDAPL